MSLFPTELASDRLRYERLHPDDADPWELYQYVHEDAPNIDEITAHVTWDPYKTPKEAFEWVDRCGQQFDDGDGATYVIRPTHGDREGAFAGLTGVHPDWEKQRALFGIWLRKPFWGEGYSRERAGRMLELVFDRLDLEVVTVAHAPDNEKSRRAIEAYVDEYGGRKEGVLRNDILIDGEPRDSVQYSISKAEWVEATS